MNQEIKPKCGASDFCQSYANVNKFKHVLRKETCTRPHTGNYTGAAYNLLGLRNKSKFAQVVKIIVIFHQEKR